MDLRLKLKPKHPKIFELCCSPDALPQGLRQGDVQGVAQRHRGLEVHGEGHGELNHMEDVNLEASLNTVD